MKQPISTSHPDRGHVSSPIPELNIVFPSSLRRYIPSLKLLQAARFRIEAFNLFHTPADRPDFSGLHIAEFAFDMRNEVWAARHRMFAEEGGRMGGQLASHKLGIDWSILPTAVGGSAFGRSSI